MSSGGGGQTSTQVVNQANPQQEALANIAQQKWDTYQRDYIPMENAYIGQIKDLNSPMYKQQATGMAAGDVQQSAEPMTENLGKSLTGGHMGMGNYTGLGNVLSGAKQAANSGVTNRYMTGQQDIVNMGNGQSTKAIQGMGSLAAQSVAAQGMDAENAWKTQQANQAVYGAGLGGLAAGGMYALGKAGGY